MPDRHTTDSAQFLLRLPRPLKEAAERLAASENRTLTNWIQTIIQREVDTMHKSQRFTVLPCRDLPTSEYTAEADAVAAIKVQAACLEVGNEVQVYRDYDLWCAGEVIKSPEGVDVKWFFWRGKGRRTALSL